MTVKELQAMRTQENIKMDAMIEIRKVLDAAEKAWVAAGGEKDEWTEQETEIIERVTEE